MYPYYRATSKHVNLHNADVSALNALYGEIFCSKHAMNTRCIFYKKPKHQAEPQVSLIFHNLSLESFLIILISP